MRPLHTPPSTMCSGMQPFAMLLLPTRQLVHTTPAPRRHPTHGHRHARRAMLCDVDALPCTSTSAVTSLRSAAARERRAAALAATRGASPALRAPQQQCLRHGARINQCCGHLHSNPLVARGLSGLRAILRLLLGCCRGLRLLLGCLRLRLRSGLVLAPPPIALPSSLRSAGNRSRPRLHCHSRAHSLAFPLNGAR